MLKAYLAGPGVFLPMPKQYGERKKRICAAYGFQGVFPMDADLDLAGVPDFEIGVLISLANENFMRQCDLLIADMTPYRGISMDTGTAFEMGFMRALGKPVLGYSNVAKDFFARAAEAFGPVTRLDSLARPQADGLALENFGMIDNLMLDGAVHHSKFKVLAEDVPLAERYTSLVVFEKLVGVAAERLIPLQP